jgi:Ca2+-binding RTX toxin-like protein
VNVNLGSSVGKTVALAPAATGLGAVEKITLTGVAVEATGNELANAIAGNGAANRLAGGLGADQLSGGGGGDSFLFFTTKDSGKKASARDTILDFTAEDLIDLSAIDARKGGKNDKFKFIGKKAFGDKKGELRFEKKSGDVVVSGDVNGDGKADFSILLEGLKKVIGGDFVL